MWEVCVGSSLLLEQGSGGVHKEGGGQAGDSRMNRNFQGEATKSLTCTHKMKFYFVILFFCTGMFMLSCVAKYHVSRLFG